MLMFWIVMGILLLILTLITVTAYVCFYLVFYVSPRRRRAEQKDRYAIPSGPIYEPHRELMIQWMKDTDAAPHEEVSITSFDGLTLRGKLYEYAPDAPIELMFHGYRGNARRDLCGGIRRCFSLGRSALIVDQRACGDSDGHVITFGVNESRDCLSWLAFMTERFGPRRPIYLTGISMGAATVMMATAKPLPPNVIGVLADCGYTSAKDIIKKVVRDMKLPPTLLYPFIRLGARLFGHFDLEETPPIEAMKACRLPILFIHGDGDDFVPCDMSRQNHAACSAKKGLVTVPDTGHGLAYLKDPEAYIKALADFFGDPLSKETTV